MKLTPLTLLLAAIAALAVATEAYARTCELTVEANDQIRYDTSEMVVGADCTEVMLTLRHTGKLAVAQMGHNWVLTKTADWQAVVQAGQGTGPESDYLPVDDERVIANTDMLGGGEADSISIDVSGLEKGGDYTFFCSFPGHYPLMNGKFIVK